MMDLKERVKEFPNSPGVYFMKDAGGRVIYIGKAASLRDRVCSYFQAGVRHPGRIEVMLRQVEDIEYIEAPSEVEALLMESRLIKDIQPRYNVNLKDSKSFPLLAISAGGDFPWVQITRERNIPDTRYFGPFTDAKELRRAVGMLQRSFRFRTCKMDIEEREEKRLRVRPCLLYSISRCSAPCAGKISKKDYNQMIKSLVAFLSGKGERLVKSLQKKMKEAADKLAYEEAARYRDNLKAILALSKRGGIDDFTGVVLDFPDAAQGLADLKERLGLSDLPRIIEGVDISSLSGKEATGAIVSFLNGVPHKQGYRRFRIKNVEGIDDYSMIREVVRRRFARLIDEGGEIPDILVVDGGAGHVSAVRNELRKLGVEDVKLVGLAKGEDRIHVEGETQPLKLESSAAALRLLAHVRDETHRFAQHYHRLLRAKALGLRTAGRRVAGMRRSRATT